MSELSEIIPCHSCGGVGREGKNRECDACDGTGVIAIKMGLDGVICVRYSSSDIEVLPKIVERLLALQVSPE